MNIKLQLPKLTDLRPRLTVVGVGGGGSNAINNMIASGLNGVSFVVANTDAQSLANSSAEHKLQLGVALTEGLGAGAKPEIGHAAAEEAIDEIRSQIAGSHMVFIAAGMGGGTGTGAAAVIARIARESGALTVGVVTKPFQFEGSRRMRAAEQGIQALRPNVDTLIVIPNQNLFRIANEKTTFADAFVMADQVLYSGVACIVDLIVKEGLINLDFADVRTIMSGMGTAMMGTGEAAGDQRAVRAAEEAIANPLLDDISLRGARGLLLSITGGRDLTLYEVDEAATRVRQEVDAEANIIVGATFDDSLGDRIRVSIVASGMERAHEAGLSSSSTPFSYAPPQQTHYGTPRGPLGQAAAQASHAGHGEAPAAGAPPVQSAMPAAAWPSNGQSSGQSGGQGDSQSRHDLGRSLTEAIASGGRDQHEPPSSQPQWTSAQGAVFEEAAPHLAMSPAPSVQPQFERLAQPQEPSFSAQPPADVRRGQRRIPDVDDFSDVAQREYRAKSEQYAAASEPRAAKGPSVLTRNAPPLAVEPPRKLGFFERLTGARRREQQVEKVADHPQAPRAASRDRSTAPPGARQRLPSGAPPTSAPHEEDTDLPVFFGQDRKAK